MHACMLTRVNTFSMNKLKNYNVLFVKTFLAFTQIKQLKAEGS